ncbi:MAG: ABC transporter permease [Roseomonas sp.]|nr:ABC transporter permease [Roseomonas sp.]
MISLILRRGALSLATLFLLATFIFFATEVLPGDALDVSLSADEVAMMPPEVLARRKAELGLDRPILERYLGFLGGLLKFDLGRTIITRAQVADIVAMPLRNSMALAAVTLLLALPVALGIAMAAAQAKGRGLDNAVSGAAIIGYSIPEFVTGLLLIAVFAVWWPIFPATITASTDDPLSVLLAAAPLAVFTTIIGSIAYLGRILRVGMIEVMASDFVERLHLSGIPRWRILLVHALPAAVIPGLSAAALYAASLVSGIVVVEMVFAYPGIGAELVRAVTRREVHVVQAIALAAAICVVSFNLLADLGISALDPRTRNA